MVSSDFQCDMLNTCCYLYAQIFAFTWDVVGLCLRQDFLIVIIKYLIVLRAKHVWSWCFKGEKEKAVQNICTTFPHDKTTTLQNYSEVWWCCRVGHSVAVHVEKCLFLKKTEREAQRPFWKTRGNNLCCKIKQPINSESPVVKKWGLCVYLDP